MAAEITIVSGHPSPQLVDDSPRLFSTPPSSVLQKSPTLVRQEGRWATDINHQIPRRSGEDRRTSDFQRLTADNLFSTSPGTFYSETIRLQTPQHDPAKEKRTPKGCGAQAEERLGGLKESNQNDRYISRAAEGKLSTSDLQARLGEKELQVSAMQAELVRCMRFKLEAEVRLQQHLHQVSV